ncbi:MAG: SDR family oxidoreductase [Candidatus Gottesmanbacteria bacterium]
MKKKKTVFVTGGSRGIGKAIVQVFKKNGLTVIAPTHEELNLQSKESILSYFIKHKIQADILVNNAGINEPEWIDETHDETIEKTVQVNLIAPIYLVRQVVPYMKKQRWGRIINISSIFGVIARGKQSLYTATKHAINGLTKSLALELAPYDILVNSVCPGFTKTQLVLRNPVKKIRALEKDVPLGRLAEPEEIARVVYYLASDESSYITGHTLVVDGGYSCK